MSASDQYSMRNLVRKFQCDCAMSINIQTIEPMWQQTFLIIGTYRCHPLLTWFIILKGLLVMRDMDRQNLLVMIMSFHIYSNCFNVDTCILLPQRENRHHCNHYRSHNRHKTSFRTDRQLYDSSRFQLTSCNKMSPETTVKNKKNCNFLVKQRVTWRFYYSN